MDGTNSNGIYVAQIWKKLADLANEVYQMELDPFLLKE